MKCGELVHNYGREKQLVVENAANFAEKIYMKSYYNRYAFFGLFIFLLGYAYAQDETITFRKKVTRNQPTAYIDSYGNMRQTSGATTYEYQFKVGGQGDYMEAGKYGNNMREYMKNCPEALEQLDSARYYRKKYAKAMAGKIVSFIILPASGIVLVVGGALGNVGLTAGGAGGAFAGIVGLVAYTKKTRKYRLLYEESLQKSVDRYNEYVLAKKGT